MILKAEKDDLSQISLTGLRAIVLLGLLIKAPRSLEEIRQAYLDYNIIEESSSYDIIRIDINTLKTMGCDISRADRRTDNKYVLNQHPFKLDINQDEINVIKQSFRKIKENLDIVSLIKYDALFTKLSSFISDNDVKESLLGISPLKRYNVSVIKELKAACKNNMTVTLVYKTPVKSAEEQMAVEAQDVLLKNDKLYLYGKDINKNESVTLNIKRILRILSKKNSGGSVQGSSVKVKFLLKTFGVSGLNDNENIISGNIESGFIIEGLYHNDFIAMQRILSFGSDCTVIEPKEFRGKIIDILKKMRDVYND